MGPGGPEGSMEVVVDSGREVSMLSISELLADGVGGAGWVASTYGGGKSSVVSGLMTTCSETGPPSSKMTSWDSRKQQVDSGLNGGQDSKPYNVVHNQGRCRLMTLHPA